VIDRLKSCGVSRIELCGFHVQPSAPESAAHLALYRDAGVGVTAYGVHHFSGSEAEGRVVFDFAKAAGATTISAHVPPGAVAVAEKLCKEYGIRIAIHNHGRKDRLGPAWALDDLFKATSPNIGLCLDTAWMLDAGEDPVAIAEKFIGRLYALHVKDFIFDRAGRPHDVVVGTGNLDLGGLLKLLVKHRWSGNCTIEYEGDVENPVPALTACVKAIQDAHRAAA
jgi:inosose dehydratase